ncbi:hypothetical protein QFZ55_002757 [Streptomyces luteogriseus]|nr:hypothetical protein [Streptomyces luteogriseus]
MGRSSPRSLESSRSRRSCSGSSLVGGGDLDVDDEVAASAAAQVRDAPAVQRDGLAGLGARADVDLLHAVERLQRHLRAEGRRRHGDRHRAVQVVAAPLERAVRQLVDLDVEVTGRTAAGADLALAGELDPRAVVDTGRDLDRERAAGADAAVARALRARGRHDRAEALALRAGAGRHDLAQEGPGDLRDLTAAAAHVTRLGGGARGRALAAAGVADDGRVDLDVLRRTEGGLVEFDLDADHRVLAAAGARARSALRRRAEERVHDVREVPEAAGSEAARAAATGLRERVAAEVVDLLLLRVRQHLVSGVDLLEPLLGLRIGVDVRVQLAREPPEGLLDLFLRRVAAHAEYGVVVRGHYDSARICPTYRATARTAPIVPG